KPKPMIIKIKPADSRYERGTEGGQVRILGSDDRVTPEIGYEVTKTILDNAEEVRSFGVPLAGVNPEDAVLNLLPSFPVNAGAAQYFKEQGTWREELIIAEV
ncbi:hypothetical protein CVM52_09210, partial [Pseudooceanicola lipolyticus]